MVTRKIVSKERSGRFILCDCGHKQIRLHRRCKEPKQKARCKACEWENAKKAKTAHRR